MNKKRNFPAFKYWRNKTKSLIFQVKRTYYQEFLKRGQCAIREFWNNLRDLVPGKSSNLLSNLNIDGILINDPVSMANGLNEWFTSVVDKFVSNNESDSTSCMKKLEDFVSRRKTKEVNFCIPDISVEFVLKHLRSLNMKKHQV